jgi:ABC-type glutathione transport system ATPase component
VTGLSLKNVTVAYGGFKALDDVNLEVPLHQTLGLVGESGSGKSTLARVVAGLLVPQKGTLELGTEPLGRRRTRDQRKRVQMVFQNPDASLNPKLTVGQQLSEALLFHRLVPRNQVADRCRQLLAQVEIDADALKKYPHEFSGGQRQRIAIARALGVEPDVLIADEPTSALDVSVQLAVLGLFQRLKNDQPLTVLFISHDLGVIHAVSDVVAVMRRGVVVEVGPKDEFFAGPRTDYGRDLLAAVPRMPGVSKE